MSSPTNYQLQPTLDFIVSYGNCHLGSSSVILKALIAVLRLGALTRTSLSKLEELHCSLSHGLLITSLKEGTTRVNLHAEGRAYRVVTSRPWMSDKRRLHESILKILLTAGDWQLMFVASRALLSRHWIAGNMTLSFPCLGSKSP